MKKQVLFLFVVLCLYTGNVLGGESHNYNHGQVTVSATGNGKVYASTTSSVGTYQTSVTIARTSNDASSSSTRTIYLWAQPNDGYTYDIAWTKSGSNITLNGTSGASTTATQTTEDSQNPTAQTITATFKGHYYNYAVNVTAGTGGKVYVSTSSSTDRKSTRLNSSHT